MLWLIRNVSVQSVFFSITRVFACAITVDLRSAARLARPCTFSY